MASSISITKKPPPDKLPVRSSPRSKKVLPPQRATTKRKAIDQSESDTRALKTKSRNTAKARVTDGTKRGKASDPVDSDLSEDSSLSDLSSSEDDAATAKHRKRVKGDKPSTSSSKGGKKTPTSGSRSTKSAATQKASSNETAHEPNTQASNASIEPPNNAQELNEQPGGTKRKRKTKAEKESEAMPLAARTETMKMFVGAHTSIAKGVENAITNAVHIGGNSFACFLKSQRKWDNPSLKDENRDAFKQHLITHKYDASNHIVPHGSYLVNLATEDPELANKSYNAFIDDLRRCEALGIRHYNFHPGAAGKAPMPEAIARLAANLNRALSETTTVIPLLENMAARGSIIGGRFADLQAVIALIKPEFKSRIGVCIDTCHAFASGYDLRSPSTFKSTLEDFDKTVGIGYLKALHLNDSKAPFSSHRDLHQNIGLGFLGLRAFHNVMNEPRFEGLPLILETPCERPDPKDPKGKKTIDDKNVWAKEIKLLESLIGMDPNSTEFQKLEKDLSGEGQADREKQQKAYDEKLRKEEKKLVKEREKGQKSVKDMFGTGGQKRSMTTAAPVENEDGSSLSELDDEE